MKLTFSELLSVVKTKSEISSIIPGFWIARSAVRIQVKGQTFSIWGFSAEFNKEKAERNSLYVLVEKFSFLPHGYAQEGLNALVVEKIGKNEFTETQKKVRQFLVGALGPKGAFYGNGCSVFTDIPGAVVCSQRELFERHVCCEIWYRRARPLCKEQRFQMNIIEPSVKLEFYTTNIQGRDYFALVSLEYGESEFFALGASIKKTPKEAFEHAAGECVMLYENFKRGKQGSCTDHHSKQKVLSLGDKEISKSRSNYLQSLIGKSFKQNPCVLPKFETIVFEPFPNIYAARTFSDEALDPREFQSTSTIPLMPLF